LTFAYIAIVVGVIQKPINSLF